MLGRHRRKDYSLSRNLGLLINHLCSKTNRKPQELAKHLGRSPTKLKQAFTGKKPLSIDELAATANWLDVPIESLLDAALRGDTTFGSEHSG
jgi:transcriptional regulator with XRE-family HTH domain